MLLIHNFIPLLHVLSIVKVEEKLERMAILRKIYMSIKMFHKKYDKSKNGIF